MPSGSDKADIGGGGPHLSLGVPFIWPEARVLAGQCSYESIPPFRTFMAETDLVSALLVGVGNGSIQWISEWMSGTEPRKMVVVVVVWPACPTRQDDLRRLVELQDRFNTTHRTLAVRVLALRTLFDSDRTAEKPGIPPTVIQGHTGSTGRTIFCVGSVGDAARDPWQVGSFNAVFQPDDALRDSWRRWFQFVFESAAALTAQTSQIPFLVPPKGDPEAARLWREYEELCAHPSEAKPPVEVVPETGEVVPGPEDGETGPWDGGTTQLDALALKLQEVYGYGRLVTVDEGSRIKPFRIPVKAALLGQDSERTVGTVTQKQSFSLQVLEVKDDKELEKCRNVSELFNLLSFQLCLGNRWIPESAVPLLEAELERRNTLGQEILKRILGGLTVTDYVKSRREKVRKDLDEMYRVLGQGDHVPEGKLEAVLADVAKRLEIALSTRITPRATYNRIAPPDLSAMAPDTNWGQPLSLLLQAARLMRAALTDRFFPQKLSGTDISEGEYCKAMDVFGDVISQKGDRRQAEGDLKSLQEVEDGDLSIREKCHAVWGTICPQRTPELKP